MIAAKTKDDYSQVMCNIRKHLSMDIIRSVLVAVRGVGGKAKKAWTAPISNVSINLIPNEKSFEGWMNADYMSKCQLPSKSSLVKNSLFRQFIVVYIIRL